MILMQLIMKHAKSENRMQIIGNRARFRYYKLVLREIGGKSMPKFRFKNCLRNTCLHTRKIFNLPPFCFCLSLCYNNTCTFRNCQTSYCSQPAYCQCVKTWPNKPCSCLKQSRGCMCFNDFKEFVVYST